MILVDHLLWQVLKFKDHKDPLVRKTTISLVPILAGFNPKAFNLSHLQPCASYMLTVMKKEKGAERSAAFLGKLVVFCYYFTLRLL
jgi:FKBP12-rapamycin complex-associated protein